MAKYKTLAELKAAYESRELSREYPLVLDNDSSSVWTEDESVYEGDPRDVLVEALNLLGIPWEHC